MTDSLEQQYFKFDHSKECLVYTIDKLCRFNEQDVDRIRSELVEKHTPEKKELFEDRTFLPSIHMLFSLTQVQLKHSKTFNILCKVYNEHGAENQFDSTELMNNLMFERIDVSIFFSFPFCINIFVVFIHLI